MSGSALAVVRLIGSPSAGISRAAHRLRPAADVQARDVRRGGYRLLARALPAGPSWPRPHDHLRRARRGCAAARAGGSAPRPGGTVSGPALFALADLAAYVVLLAHVGPEPLMVTTNMTMNFMRRPPLAPLIGRMPDPEARQAARGRGGGHPARGGRRPRGARDGHVFDTAALSRSLPRREIGRKRLG